MDRLWNLLSNPGWASMLEARDMLKKANQIDIDCTSLIDGLNNMEEIINNILKDIKKVKKLYNEMDNNR